MHTEIHIFSDTQSWMNTQTESRVPVSPSASMSEWEGSRRLWPLRPATRILLLRVLFHCWRFRFLSSAQRTSASYGAALLSLKGIDIITNRESRSESSRVFHCWIRQVFTWVGKCRMHVCSVIERHNKLHCGGKKHPLMIKLKVALVISRAFGSLGVNMAWDSWTLSFFFYTKQ